MKRRKIIQRKREYEGKGDRINRRDLGSERKGNYIEIKSKKGRGGKGRKRDIIKT